MSIPQTPISRPLYARNRWLSMGLGMWLLLMGSVSFSSYRNALQLTQSAQRLRLSNRAVKEIGNIATTVTDAESGRRGYILLNDQDEFQRYQNAITHLREQLPEIENLLSDTPDQQSRLQTLRSSIQEWLSFSQQSIEYYKNVEKTTSNSTSRLPRQDPLSEQLKRERDDILDALRNLITAEQALLDTEVLASESGFRRRMLLEVLGTVLVFLTMLVLYALLYNQLIQRQKAEVRQQQLAQEKELSDLKLQFFSMVSHEFRTPLSLIIGSSQLLRETLPPNKESSNFKNLDRIQMAAKSLSQMLNDLLTLARADAGTLGCNLAWTELQTFCLNLLEDVQLAMKVDRVINFQIQSQSTYGWVDEKLLYAILSNLLSNAIKYSPADTSIDFALECTADFVTIQVKDQGPGIAPEVQERLFEPFWRGADTQDIRGTGLGLAVVKRCVDRHGGELNLESQVGGGTTFTIRLPLPQPKITTDETDAPSSPRVPPKFSPTP